ncbi:metal dependent phosphohydrolase [Methanothermus fervidus DSM 2088]|uniref:Metal dependent phosphohydrolase n=1 Tax=Methanothermus fervidus (strain ATCC 43054 / DSM 2088 / JCM 10308 / V24 S) TaxID=523846 RepID=E3GW84_METFV|nr:TIGR00295 family protein [Methanothermus fervidus]ADP77849.1 metal dependent phosphohydrolase [Methanothermus fervidus DSM 2088]
MSKNKSKIFKLYKEVNLPENVIEHCKVVAERALELSTRFNNVDRELVLSGALLHDIGRSKTHGIDHGIVGAKILRKKGYPEEIIRIVERHIGAGIPKNEAIKLGLPPKDYIPETLEEKIVAHADNLVNGNKKVDIHYVLKKWESKFGRDHPAIKRLKKLHKELTGEDV